MNTFAYSPPQRHVAFELKYQIYSRMRTQFFVKQTCALQYLVNQLLFIFFSSFNFGETRESRYRTTAAAAIKKKRIKVIASA